MDVTVIESILKDYVEKLESLGSPDAIALHFQGKQVRAFCGEPKKCAIAEDLTRELHLQGVLFSHVSVGSDVEVFQAFEAKESVACTELGDHAELFIGRFDEGQYRDLIHATDNDGLAVAEAYAAGVR